MKYCEGKCRREYLKHEGSLNGCRHHRSYKDGVDSKNFEVCLKVSNMEKIWRWIIFLLFKDFLELNDYRGGRLSKTVQKNRNLL